MGWAILGVALLFLVFSDAFITVFSSQGGGLLTNAWTQWVWRVLLAIHQRRAIHHALSIAGPLMMLSIVIVWYALMVTGWTCVFLASDKSVVNSDMLYVTTWHEKAFFVGVTMSTLGYGNMVPLNLPWTVVANLTALSGTVLLTSGLSYVITVLTAAIERRQLSSQIHSIGLTVDEFVQRAWAGNDRCHLDSHLLNIASQLDQHGHKHVNYPILRHFHSEYWRKSPGPAVLLLSDSVFLISHATSKGDCPPCSVLHVLEQSIASYLEQANAGLSFKGLDQRSLDAERESPPPKHLQLEVIRHMGREPADYDAFIRHWREYAPRRLRLVRLCEEDGWQDISSSKAERGC